MNLLRYPHLLERLAAEHALGLVPGGAERRLRLYAERDAAIRGVLEEWRHRVAPLAELAAPSTPPASVWPAIERQLGWTPAASRPPAGAAPTLAAGAGGFNELSRRLPRWFERLSFWRGWAIGMTVLAALAIVIAVRSLLSPAPGPSTVIAEQHPAGATHVAVLLNSENAHAVLLVAWDEAHATMTLRPLATVAPPPGRAMELWGVPASGHPVALGMLPEGGAGTLPAGEKRPGNYAALAISIEPPGGSTNPDGPSGPVVLVGKLLPLT